eukprot:TRINITY_DN44328_c0_g1_i1.p1 TRINITY_DN44328_c0_g1~~TRINITY_DN44328_c0_g1_i1.p1  ORF type:complete len:432 (+),score=111.36 TRINITY_DN44328_c0_g1_i1:67-1362(+)
MVNIEMATRLKELADEMFAKLSSEEAQRSDGKYISERDMKMKMAQVTEFYNSTIAGFTKLLDDREKVIEEMKIKHKMVLDENKKLLETLQQLERQGLDATANTTNDIDMQQLNHRLQEEKRSRLRTEEQSISLVTQQEQIVVSLESKLRGAEEKIENLESRLSKYEDVTTGKAADRASYTPRMSHISPASFRAMHSSPQHHNMPSRSGSVASQHSLPSRSFNYNSSVPSDRHTKDTSPPRLAEPTPPMPVPGHSTPLHGARLSTGMGQQTGEGISMTRPNPLNGPAAAPYGTHTPLPAAVPVASLHASQPRMHTHASQPRSHSMGHSTSQSRQPSLSQAMPAGTQLPSNADDSYANFIDDVKSALEAMNQAEASRAAMFNKTFNTVSGSQPQPKTPVRTNTSNFRNVPMNAASSTPGRFSLDRNSIFQPRY